MTTPDINIPQWHFRCTNCGDCCRRWHVAISAAEKERLRNLEWPEDEQPRGALITEINGHEYLAHTTDGACIFLDTVANRCKIHNRFGYEAKPLGCRVYPLNIATTFPGQYSAIGRFDCSALRQNHGTPIAAARDDIRGYIREMGLRGGFDRFVLDDLSASQIQTIVRGFFDHLFTRRDMDIPQQLLAAMTTAHRLEKLDPDFVNQVDLEQILPSFFQRSIDTVRRLRLRSPNFVERTFFLAIWISFLRRDEDLVGQGMGPRLARSVAIARLFLTKGNLRPLGKEHPEFHCTTRALFSQRVANQPEIDWDLFRELIKLRLQSYQFFGVTYYNLSFFIGLKSLFFSFPLVIAAAKWAALARYPSMCCILPEDVDYAVGVIDHNLGRSALLGTGMFTTMVRQLSQYDTYSYLVRGLL